MRTTTTRIRIAGDKPGPAISRHLFGHFAEHVGRCVYDGIWVGTDSPIPNIGGIRRDFITALQEIRAPNLRWPGGCFADGYHWRNGIGPQATRPRMRNDTWGELESNAFGTHEFLGLCALTGCDPILAGNVGSGTVEEMRDWVEYVNAPTGAGLGDRRAANGHAEPYRVRYWGIGNESWGCGGTMRADFYANLYRQFATQLSAYDGVRPYRIACGPGSDDYEWTETLMRECAGPRFFPGIMDALSLHYYVNGEGEIDFSATRFTRDGWDAVMAQGWYIDHLIRRHSRIMDRYDPDRRIALVVDEWGSWYRPEPETKNGSLFQQQTIRDAVLAALTLNIFIDHSARVRMANLAQVANVLQAIVLTDGPDLVRTPTWHVFRMYVPHHDALRLPVETSAPTTRVRADLTYHPTLSCVASRAPDNSITVTIANTDPEDEVTIELGLRGTGTVLGATALVLRSEALTSINVPGQSETVKTVPFTDFRSGADGVSAKLCPASVTSFTFRCP